MPQERATILKRKHELEDAIQRYQSQIEALEGLIQHRGSARTFTILTYRGEPLQSVLGRVQDGYEDLREQYDALLKQLDQ